MEKLKADASQLASNAAEFNEIVAPLERRSQRRLNGFGRSVCIRAFSENPDGFRACVSRAIQKGNGSPVGLLVKMCRDGDHDLPEIPPPPRGHGSCFVCDAETDDAIYLAGQWWCERCAVDEGMLRFPKPSAERGAKP